MKQKKTRDRGRWGWGDKRGNKQMNSFQHDMQIKREKQIRQNIKS